MKTSYTNVLLLTVVLGGSTLHSGFVQAESAKLSADLSANEIVTKSEEKYDGNTQISESSMLLIDGAGNKRLRKMKSFRRDFGNNLKDQKTIYFFEYPEDIKDTSYLSFDWEPDGVDDDSWLYLPALKKVKRLAAADKSDAFLGSDFTYTDIKTSKRQYWDYTIVSATEKIDGHECWLVEGLPKKGNEEKVRSETGYSKVHVWVRKDNFVKVQGTFWVLKGKKIKYFTATDIEEIQGIWTARTNQISTTKNGKVEHTTVIKLDKVIYDQEIDESYFTPQKMNRGV
jgi:hypothetical protein